MDICRENVIYTISASVAFYTETSNFIYIANQITGFYMKCNAELKLVNQDNQNIEYASPIIAIKKLSLIFDKTNIQYTATQKHLGYIQNSKLDFNEYSNNKNNQYNKILRAWFGFIGGIWGMVSWAFYLF